MDSDGNPMTENKVYPMPKAMSFSALAFIPADSTTHSGGTGMESQSSVDVRIEAIVYPDDAANKEVDFSVAWGNAPTYGSETLTDYLTVTPDSTEAASPPYPVKGIRQRHDPHYRHDARRRIYRHLYSLLCRSASGIEITSSTAAKTLLRNAANIMSWVRARRMRLILRFPTHSMTFRAIFP